MEELILGGDHLSHEVLDYLYKDEAINISMIHSIETKTMENSKFYVNYLANKVQGILHVKKEGDTKISQFYSHNKEGLKSIAKQIEKIKDGEHLIVGKEEDVRYIGEYMSLDKGLLLNQYYKLNPKKFICSTQFPDYRMNQILRNETNCNSRFELFYRERQIGVANFACWSQNYVEIKDFGLFSIYQNIGHEKIFLCMLAKKALENKKTPIILLSPVNVKAKKNYESLGFELFCNYTFRIL